MAEITNSEAVKFCNERVRIVADKLAQVYYIAKSVSQEWTANNLGDIIAYNNSDLVVDGSAIDGRHQISGIDVNNVITRCNEIVSDFEANNNAKLNTILAVSTHNN